jgi:hypothetical protein
MITTTLNRIKAHNPCADGWKKLLTSLNKTQADDEPLSFADIVKSNGLRDALWATQVEPQHKHVWMEFALYCAQSVEHLMKDPRSVALLRVLEKFVAGTATQEELDEARAAADYAATATATATTTAADADADAVTAAADAVTAYAADYAADADTAYAVYAVCAAGYAADAVTAYAAYANAYAADYANAYATARDKQTQKFLELVSAPEHSSASAAQGEVSHD